MRGKRSQKTGRRARQRYVIHPVRMGAWVEDYDSGVRLEGLTEAVRVVSRIKDFMAGEFPRAAVPPSEFEYTGRAFSWTIRVPTRDLVCYACDHVAMITGFSRMIVLRWDLPAPDDYSAPICVIEAVTRSLTSALREKLGRTRSSQNQPEGTSIGYDVSSAIHSAIDEAVCNAVDALDGIAPDCDRELIEFGLRSRRETGPPDPFSSKSRFRNDLMQALVWWFLPKKEFRRKAAEHVTVGDLVFYFSLAGYFDGPPSSPSGRNPEDQSGGAGGDERTLRRWMRKYANNYSGWPALRSSLIETIRRAGYHLPGHENPPGS